MSQPRRPSDRRPRRGEVWYVFTPGQPDDPHQPCPAVVVSENVRNRMRDDLIVVPVFSGGQLGPTRVRLPSGAGGLRHQSVVFCEEITTIDRDFLASGPAGVLAPSLVDAVVRGIRRAIGEVVTEP
ncbi:MAG: type II toxin-antitoxin system PemK/MazF family toxin [Chloroflexi bacterium]|nr:MAG: type II toxin-antitoxin system PemK/MazF family toxin [Chloroflexota bacterium]